MKTIPLRTGPIRTGPIRTFTRMAFANRASAAYLALVGGAMAVAALEPLFTTSPDASLIWVWPALFTFPAFGFVAWLGEAGWGGDAPAWFFIGGIVLAALVQSLALGAVWQALRGHREERRGRLTAAS
ncbi:MULTISPECIES: SCO4225 family membrane protein [unclassified Streptomyces]|uniref:SCO4225 family membrane protein n=1 Tax=unclassified Streptomyces TaxID=2593676 RepID=UPI003321FFAB